MDRTIDTTMSRQPVTLGARFDRALDIACELHRFQWRKGSNTPYVGHLLAVAALVLEHGGTEDQAIAALLHDAVEDQGGLATLARIRDEFGDHVADMVAECSDSTTTPKPPWRSRKESYLARLQHTSGEVILVSLADKVHNARTILSDYRISGEALWSLFRGEREGTLWYYRSLVDVFRQITDNALVQELARVVEELESISRTR